MKIMLGKGRLLLRYFKSNLFSCKARIGMCVCVSVFY
jgi:hypothetical protein